jgi:hypothetical protein
MPMKFTSTTGTKDTEGREPECSLISLQETEKTTEGGETHEKQYVITSQKQPF